MKVREPNRTQNGVEEAAVTKTGCSNQALDTDLKPTVRKFISVIIESICNDIRKGQEYALLERSTHSPQQSTTWNRSSGLLSSPFRIVKCIRIYYQMKKKSEYGVR